MRFETLTVHSGPGPDPVTGGVAPPIHLATTFARDATGMPLGGHTYIRESNPNQAAPGGGSGAARGRRRRRSSSPRGWPRASR